MESIFKRVKSSVTPKQAATRYGLKVQRGDIACCPFHNDRHPSMKLYPDHYHCFSCKATGDVISLTARLLQMSPYAAAKKLENDFCSDSHPTKGPVKAHPRQNVLLNSEQRDWLIGATNVLQSVRDQLEDRRIIFAPRTPEEYLAPAFVEACHLQPRVEYLLDLACSPDDKDRLFLITEFRKEVGKLEQSILRRSAEGNGNSAKLPA
ncbi:MAG: DNA primase [Clostridia bacterium]|nr:DNA primase [Clostridia bacterium]